MIDNYAIIKSHNFEKWLKDVMIVHNIILSDKQWDINFYLQWGCKMMQLLQETVRWFLKKLKIPFLSGVAIPVLGFCPSKVGSRSPKRDLYTHIHSNVRHESQKVKATQASFRSGGRTYRMCLDITTDYYSALEGQDILTRATIGRKLRHIILREMPRKRQILYNST